MTLRRAAVLALAVAGCLALPGCALFDRAADQIVSAVVGAVDDILLAFFALAMSFCALTGVVFALVRGIRRERRSPLSYLSVASATLFAVAAVWLQLSVAGTIGRTQHTLRLMLLSSSPLYWLAAAVIELVLAPALPPGPTGEPPRLTAARVAAAVIPVAIALTLYGLLLDHAVKLVRGEPFWWRAPSRASSTRAPRARGHAPQAQLLAIWRELFPARAATVETEATRSRAQENAPALSIGRILARRPGERRDDPDS